MATETASEMAKPAAANCGIQQLNRPSVDGETLPQSGPAVNPKPPLPWFRFFPADFVADENVIVMTLEEVGAYVLLLAYDWREGSIPADPKRIARLLRVDEATAVRLWEGLSPCFGPNGEPGRLCNGRLAKERADAEALRARRVLGGRKTAAKRWGDSSASSPAIGKLQLSGSYSHSHSQSEGNTPPTGVEAPGKPAITPQMCLDVYQAYPIHLSKQEALKAIRKVLESGQRTYAQLLADVTEYATAHQGRPDDMKLPYPATWMNHARWEDDRAVWSVWKQGNRNGGNGQGKPAPIATAPGPAGDVA